MAAASKQAAKKVSEPTVGDLERLLFAAYPATAALEGDRIGLMVGDAASPVSSIALALDASVDAIETAFALGCNVLITHHPVFWVPPTLFLREAGMQSQAGITAASAAAVYRALEKGVALISMHSNLDCAPSAAMMLLEPAVYEYCGPIVSPEECSGGFIPRLDKETASEKKRRLGPKKPVAGLGQFGAPFANVQPATLAQLAQRYRASFGAVAKVWGNYEKPIKLLATCSGGGGDLIPWVMDADADCYVTGELRYHEAQELIARGVAIIELGHDRSELPYRFFMRETLLTAHIPAERIHIIEPSNSWWQP